MQPTPVHYSSRLRELGFVSPSDRISYVDLGEWRQGGQFFVARMVVGVVNGEGQKERAYWLKCPHDFWCDLNDVVYRRVRIANQLREAGCNIPRTEWFEPSTMIQEEVVGRKVPSDRDMPEWAVGPLRREKGLYERAGLRYMDGIGDNFIIDDQGRAWCIDLDFNEIKNPAKENAASPI
ncbi:MAG: hypothetical protein HY515_00445 [Candidatus Aenigmarchaeota archaeon]|nr:hypothetical protein [Candidatus Aenigmarchaeota archaeon]